MIGQNYPAGFMPEVGLELCLLVFGLVPLIITSNWLSSSYILTNIFLAFQVFLRFFPIDFLYNIFLEISIISENATSVQNFWKILFDSIRIF